MKRKFISILFALVLVLSLSLVTAVPAGADDAYEPTIGWWQSSNPNSGVAEFSTAQVHSADYSAHLEAFIAFSKNDYHEVYVANPTGVVTLNDLDSVSLWYYCPAGDNDVAPLIDVWLDMDGTYSPAFPPTGDDEWLLGMIDDVTTHDAWVEVPLSDIEWVRATGGTIYGDGDAGLSAAKAETNSGSYTTLGDCPILAIGVETGGPGTYISSRSFDMDFYVDDITINGVTYAMDPRVINTTQTTGYVTIQEAIDSADPNDTISVAEGTYGPFTVDGKTGLTIKSSSTVIVQGAQLVTTAYTDRGCVVFVKDSTNIVLDGLDIEGLNLGNLGDGGRDYGVIYEDSSGEIKNCTVSPNTSGDVNSIAIGIWDGSEVTVDTCTIHNFGRVGILIYNACTASVLDSTIDGQVYSGVDEVSYGIEVEAPTAELASACQVTIRGNEIYNCDNTFSSPQPSWESAAILINGWLEQGATPLEADCTVIVENNDIHDNYIGIYAVKTPSSYAHYNNIYDNRVYGVISAAAGDASTAVFDATNNWWGSASGPKDLTGTTEVPPCTSDPTTEVNADGTGDEVSDNVDYCPWQTAAVGGATVGMTAQTPQIVAISVTPTSIDFGTLYPGQTSPATTITVENIGTVVVDVDTSILDSEGVKVETEGNFFYDNLYLPYETTKASAYTTNLTVGGDATVDASVNVPSDYPAVGVVTGTLVFEATAS